MKAQKLLTSCLFLCAFISVNAQSTYLPVDTVAPSIATFTLSGGSMESYGCDGLDPTYWLSGNGNSVTVTFVEAQTNPSFRVWGMNDDDFAEVMVNGVSYPLMAGSASYDPKVICSTTNPSPGPDGVLFSSGLLVGANTNTQGNYSYQDVNLLTTGVNSISIVGVAGAGWGVDGFTITEDVSSIENNPETTLQFDLAPNPVSHILTISGLPEEEVSIALYNTLGQTVLLEEGIQAQTYPIDLQQFPAGPYFLSVISDAGSVTQRVIKR